MRSFLALQPPLDLRTGLAARVRGERLEEAGFRTSGASEIHLTLRFLGNVPEEELRELERTLRARLSSLPAPRLRFGSAGAFPSFTRPRVLWIGIEEDERTAGRLAALGRAIGVALAEVPGLPERTDAKRPWTPHVTVARPRSVGITRVPQSFARIAAEGTWSAEEVVLFESRPERPSGARYRPHASFALRATE